MRKYLENFMAECEYCAEDSRILLAAYEVIHSNDASRKILEYAISEYERDYTLDFKPITELFPKIAELSGVHEYTVALIVFLCLTRHMRELYRERGICDSVFLHTALDLRYKLRECKQVKHICGTFVAFWYPIIFNLELFALGRLQFHIKPLNRDYRSETRFLPEGTPVLNIHIPNDSTPLTPSSVRESLCLARDFFRDTLGDDPAFICHSWLLWPEHEKMLKPESNLIAFLHEFELLDYGLFSNQNVWWRVFGTNEKNPDLLPTDTSLRRAYAELLRRGEPSGWGFGIKFLN